LDKIEPSQQNSTPIHYECRRGMPGAVFGLIEGACWGSLPGLIMLLCAICGFWQGRGFLGAAFFLVIGVVFCSVLGGIIGSVFPKIVGRILGCLVGMFICYILGGILSGGIWSPYYLLGMIVGAIIGAVAGAKIGKKPFRILFKDWKQRAIGPLK
jgi:hypothetical protein